MGADQVNRLLGLAPQQPAAKRGKQPAPTPAPAADPPATLEVELADDLEQRRRQILQRQLERQAARREAQLVTERALAAMRALALDLELPHAAARAGAVMWALADDDGVYHGSARQLAPYLLSGVSRATGHVARLVRAGWAVRRPDGTYRMLGASSEHVATPPGARAPQARGSRASGARNDPARRAPRPLKGSRGNRAASRAGASPSPGTHPAERSVYPHPTSCSCEGTGFVESPDEPGRLMRCPEVHDQ